MSIAVYLTCQNTSIEAPAHKANSTLAMWLVAGRYAAWVVTKRSVRLIVDLSWSALKLMFKPVITAANSSPIPRLLQPLPFYQFDTSYPPAGQETNARELQRKLWSGQAMIPYRERVLA